MTNARPRILFCSCVLFPCLAACQSSGPKLAVPVAPPTDSPIESLLQLAEPLVPIHVPRPPTPILVGQAAPGHSVWAVATKKWIYRGCPGDYVQVQVEARRFADEYQGVVTNLGERAKCLRQNEWCDLPSQARLPLDIGNQQAKWRARMLSSIDISNCDLTHCVCSGNLQQTLTDWQEFSPGMVSFTVPQVYTAATSTIISSQLIGGTLISGSLNQIAAEDSAGPKLRHTGPLNVNIPSVQAQFHLGWDDITNIQVAVSTFASRACMQTITALRIADQQWVVLNLQSVGTTELRLKGLTLPGSPTVRIPAKLTGHSAGT